MKTSRNVVKSIARLPAVLPVCRWRGRSACVSAWVARAAAGPGQRTRGEMRACTTRQRPPTERERRLGSGPIPTTAERRRRSEVVEPGDATKAALCRGALKRSLDRSFRRSGRGVRVRRPLRHDNKRNDKNATAAALARETHSSLHPSPANRQPAAMIMLIL